MRLRSASLSRLRWLRGGAILRLRLRRLRLLHQLPDLDGLGLDLGLLADHERPAGGLRPRATVSGVVILTRARPIILRCSHASRVNPTCAFKECPIPGKPEVGCSHLRMTAA